MKAVVTGASRGIGEAIARALAHEGYDLYLMCDRTFDVLCRISEDISKQYNVNVYPLKVDVSDEFQVQKAFENIKDPDVLVNNAGISYVGLLSEMSGESWRHIMQVNIDSMFYCSREALKDMLHNHSGRIINISSIWGNVGASMEVAYSASKGAVNSFTRALAKEVAPSHISVNAIACGVIDTEMNKCFSKEEMDALAEDIPADRIGKPEEIADFVVKLAKSPEYLTGQVITIDGGYL